MPDFICNEIGHFFSLSDSFVLHARTQQFENLK
jgi:hypothetical protein